MKGKRFNAPGMPANAAAEVGAYKEAIFEIARQLWLRDNDRTRVSPGALDSFDLRLIAVEEGSTKPLLKLHHASTTPKEIVDEWEPYFEKARDSLTTAVRTLSSKGAVPAWFPAGALPEVAKLGRSLRDDETVTIGSPEPGKRGASFDRELKETIRKISEVLREGPRRVEEEGVIVEFDSQRASFTLNASRGVGVACRLVYDEPLAKRARDLCSLDGVVAPDVRIVGTTTDDDDNVRLIYDVSEITEVRSVWEKGIMSRLSILHDLNDGWHGPNSFAPNSDALAALDEITREISNIGHGIRIGATPSGAIAFEWTDADIEYTAEIGTDLVMMFFIDDASADEVQETERPFDSNALLSFLSHGEIA